jgi:hypothetical protein
MINVNGLHTLVLLLVKRFSLSEVNQYIGKKFLTQYETRLKFLEIEPENYRIKNEINQLIKNRLFVCFYI